MKIFNKIAASIKDRTVNIKKTSSKKRTRFLGNIKIAPKLLACFLIISLLCAVVGVYASLSLLELGESSQTMYANIVLPARNIGDIQKDFQDSVSGYHQFLLSTDSMNDVAYISKIQAALTRIPQKIFMLESTADKKTSERIESLKESFESYKLLIENDIEKYESGQKQQLIDNMGGVSAFNEAEGQMQSQLYQLSLSVTGDATSINTRNQKTAQTVFTNTVISAGALVILSILIGTLISRSLSKPIKMLTKRAKQLAAGDTDFEITGAVSKDEIGQMREAIRTIIKSVRMLADDTNMLIQAANEGKLSVRADAEKHQGSYRTIVEGVNATLDAMIAPIRESAEVLGELAQGNLAIGVESDFAGDFAIIKNALNDTIATLRSYIGEISSVLGDVSAGVLTNSIKSDFKGDFTILKHSINMSIDSFSGVLKDINMAAEEVSLGATQLSGGSQVISQGATEQASALEELTATVSEIADKTKNNANSAAQTNTRSLAAMEYAASGNEKMEQLQLAMEEISTSSASISKIIKVIDGIAFQTNILALNAAVEAARAGTHGKGFAVVAEEVRNLAARSAKAAQETAELIEGSIVKTTAGTKVADETAAALRNIVESIKDTVALSGEIAEASNEQATGVSQVNKGIEQLSNVVQNSSATAQQAAASSEELAAQAEHLKQMVGRFHFKQDKKTTNATETMADDAVSEKHEASFEKTDIKFVLTDDDFGKF